MRLRKFKSPKECTQENVETLEIPRSANNYFSRQFTSPSFKESCVTLLPSSFLLKCEEASPHLTQKV